MDRVSTNGGAIEFRAGSYGSPNGQEVLSRLNLEVLRGETFVLLGRSGSGKTTTLKLINRLLSPNAGEVRVDDAATARVDVIALRRRIGYVIQDVGLFPHFTVERNIALVPRIEGWGGDRIREQGQELLPLVGLEHQLGSRHRLQRSGRPAERR